MASSVQVLCPNGHRVNVKITPNTTILQILEEACAKKSFLPPEQYELKHGRKTLDVTQTIRYSGLPNLAKLELVKAANVRAESKVTIALQLEDGERLPEEFSPNTALWEILKHWENTEDGRFTDRFTKSHSAGHHPVCIYMREEIIGEFALKETSLRSLGLTGGKAILRFLHREVDEGTLTSIKSSIEKKKNILQKLSKNQSTASPSASSNSDKNESTQSSESPTDIVREGDNTTDRNLASSSAGERQDESMDMEVTSCKSLSSTEVRGGEPMETETIADPLDQLNQIPGIQVFRPGAPVTGLTQEEQQVVSSVSQSLQSQLRGARPKSQTTKSLPQSDMQPVEFKFPESTKGKDLYHNELSDVNKEEYTACDREVVVYALHEQTEQGQKTDQDVPDDFFELTEADLRMRMKELTRKVDETNAAPLMTSVMRRAQLEQKLDRYKRCIIRVHFPDKHVLQAVFRPRESVHALHKFVSDHLADKKMPFYLYTTPPKCVLNDKAQMLGEANLIPMAVVHFGSELTQDTYLVESDLQDKGTQSVADTIVMRIMMPDGKSEPQEKSMDTTRAAVKRSEPSKKSPSSEEGKKVPKWFTVGKK